MDQNVEKEEYVNIKDIFFTFRKHFLIIVTVTIICGVLGFLISDFFITPEYKADATIIVNPGQTSQSSNITYDQVTTAQQLVGTYSIILKSDTVLDQVIKDLGLNITSTKLAKDISISGVNSTEVIDLSVKSKSPKEAADIANDITKVAPDIIIKTVKAGSVEVISSAKPNYIPVSPNIPLYTGIAFIGGLVISILISLGIEFFDNTFSSDEDVIKNIGIPVIGIIPFTDSKS